MARRIHPGAHNRVEHFRKSWCEMSCGNGNGLRGKAVETAKQSNNSTNYEAIKAILQSGRDVRLLDFPQKLRPAVVGVIAQLRDELPIRRSWQTIRESHLSETLLRARRYFIPGEFLREVDDAI